MDLLISLISFLFLMFLGIFIGGTTERRHLARLKRQEAQLSDMLVTQLKSFPLAAETGVQPCMVVGEVVIASDYLKTFFAKFRGIFGGEMHSYNRMLIRARREAIIRMMHQAEDLGFNAICNVRMHSADVGGSTMDRKVPMAPIIATGTAYTYSQP